MFVLSPVIRRFTYVIIFEALAIVLSTLVLMTLIKGHASDSVPVAVATSMVALVWNFIFNTLFEIWERLTRRTDRTLIIRAVHAILFEGGLFLFTTPMYIWWYKVSFIRAIEMEFIILVFFLIYTFVFTLLFDRIVALPKQYSRQA